VWVILYNERISIYSNRFGGDSCLIRTIEKRNIEKVTPMNMETLANINVDILELTLTSADGLLAGEVVRLAWRTDSNVLKDTWLRALSVDA
jgi:hypothetical protein